LNRDQHVKKAMAVVSRTFLDCLSATYGLATFVCRVVSIL